jgi:putative peptidoglycan lipid II flippase
MSETQQVTDIEGERTAQSELAGSATLLAVGSAASRLLGLAREVMINTLFGPTGEVGAFRLASQIPVWFYDFLIGGMLSAALVPVLSQYAQQRNRIEFDRLVSSLVAILSVLLLALVVLLEVFAPQLGWLTAGGYNQTDPALLSLTINLLRLSLPVIWFMCMVGLSTAVLHALKRFSIAALSTALFNLCILIVGPLLAKQFGVASLVIGMLVGTIAQLATMGGDLWRAGVRLRWHVDWRHPALAQIVRLYLPIAAGVVVSLLQVGLDRRLATSTHPQSIPWMASATTLQQLPLGLISIAISLAALPRLSQFFVQGDEANYRATLSSGLRMVLLLIVPAAMVLWTLSEPVVRLLFEHNRFTPADTQQVSAALDIYVLGMIFAAIDYPLNFAFYARQNTRLPALVGVVSVGFYLLAAWALMEPLGYLGLVWADTAKQIGHMVIMLGLISWQVGMRRELLDGGLVWILLAGVVAGAVMWALSLALAPVLDGALGNEFVRDLALLVIAGGSGMVAYALLLHWVRLPELATAASLLQKRLGRGR